MMFSGKQTKPTFKSYLPPLQTDLKKSPQLPIKKLEAKLLPGEIVVNEANFVRKCIGAESCQDDLWGKLVCTNFKVSFIAHNSLPRQRFQCTHRLLGSFRFDEAGPESAKKVCLAIAHYSHPADPQLLFGFEYVGKRYHGSTGERVNGVDPGGGLQTPLFDCSSDWDREIKRTGASEWRVCTINQGYFISPSLPEFFVVPVSLADQDLKQYACCFYSQRIPLWCWNHSSGSALVRMSNISDLQQQRKVEQRICSAITKSHPLRSDVFKLDLDKNLPNIQDIQAALLKLRQICVIGNQKPAGERDDCGTHSYVCLPLSLSSLQDFASSKSIHLGQDQALRFPPVWDWSQQFSLKDQTLFNNPLYVGKIATCVQNGTVKTFTHRRSKKNYSSTLRGLPSALRNGSLGPNDTLARRNSLVLRLRSDLSQVREQQETPSERFVRDFFSRPVDLQGLLLPQLLPSHLSVWKLYFLRWVPEAQIPQGGPITAFHKLSVLTDEIEMLQNQLRQYQGAAGTPNNLHAEHSKMYFKATPTPHQSPAPPEYLSSSFPFSPVGNLCRPGILGTPLSKLLNGAKIWLSTETLANETI
ncbi:myotubularin-related protein 10-like [Sinocyclocheilus grahami]|uniref:myotubularin-related protein 10-like n=1 Tax=Sinocyclocheilus grahami TaxID=75366 RepID=UPI0007AD2F70|nr:PREDICTED: myotubularin-related protein 10-like [Sinocyclocheilus grahami]